MRDKIFDLMVVIQYFRKFRLSQSDFESRAFILSDIYINTYILFYTRAENDIYY